MSFLRLLIVPSLTLGFMLTGSLAYAGTPAAANVGSTQQAIVQIQKQVQQVSISTTQQLSKIQSINQAAILSFQKQTQVQIARLQAEIQQVQSTMSKQLAQVQKEVQQEAKIK
jgi:hypothetical protein